MQVCKTISGLSKVMIGRLNIPKAEEGFTFIIDVMKKASGVESGEILSVVKFKHELAGCYLLGTDNSGKPVYDKEDRPRKMANECKATVESIIGDDEQFSYLRAKAIAQIGKAELVLKNVEKTAELFLQA